MADLNNDSNISVMDGGGVSQVTYQDPFVTGNSINKKLSSSFIFDKPNQFCTKKEILDKINGYYIDTTKILNNYKNDYDFVKDSHLVKIDYNTVITFEISHIPKVPNAISIGLKGTKYNDFEDHPTSLDDPYIFSINPRISPKSNPIYFYDSIYSTTPYGYAQCGAKELTDSGYLNSRYFIGEFHTYKDNSNISLVTTVDTSNLMGDFTDVTIRLSGGGKEDSYTFEVSESLQIHAFTNLTVNTTYTIYITTNQDVTMFDVYEKKNRLTINKTSTYDAYETSFKLTSSIEYEFVFTK